MKTILITGGAGFLGSNLVAGLQDRQDWRIVVCDRFGEGPQWQNLVHHRVDEVIAPDDLFFWLEEFGENVDTVVHFGNIADTAERDADALLESNFSLSVLLWRWCAEASARFVFASSSEVYGDGAAGFVDSNDPGDIQGLRPLNPNGWTKKLFEHFVALEVSRDGPAPAQYVGLRCFNLYGPNEYHKGEQRSVLAKLFHDARYQNAVKLFKSGRKDIPDGEQKRDFTYVKDVTAVIRWMLDHPDVAGIFNVGTGRACSFNALAEALFKALGSEPQIKYIDMPVEIAPRYQYFTQASLERLRAAGYEASFTSLEDGVRDYVQNYLMQPDPYR